MKIIELITSKEYWVETLELMQMQGHTDYDIATVIANKMEKAMNYIPCCETLKSEYIPDFENWLKENKYRHYSDNYYIGEDNNVWTVNGLAEKYVKETNL